jgi:hypothetical protein
MFIKIDVKDLKKLEQFTMHNHNGEIVIVNLNLSCSILFLDNDNLIETVSLNEFVGNKFFFKDLETYEKYKSKILKITEEIK